MSFGNGCRCFKTDTVRRQSLLHHERLFSTPSHIREMPVNCDYRLT